MQNRRKFIQNLSNAGLGMLFFTRCHQKNNSGNIAEGEEWKNSSNSYDNKNGNYALNPQLREKTRAAIEKYRKGPLRLRLIDNNGHSLSGHRVDVQQTSHHFDWGFSGARDICSNNPVDKKMTGYIKRLFNCTTAKCYWDEGWHQPIEHEEGKRIRDKFVNEVKWGRANGLRVKGHPLVWTVRKAIPRWIDKYPYKVQIEKLEEHVRDMIQTGGEEVKKWDLCNEMLWEPSLRNLPKRKWPHIETIEEILTYLEPAVHWAKNQNPFAIYSLNDYGLVKTNAPGVTSRQQRKRYVELVKEMQRRGCAPDAIGSQCHVTGWYTDNEFLHMLDELSEAGLPIQVTEFWAKLKDCPFKGIDDENKMNALLKYMEMIYSLAFAHPSVNHLTYWGNHNWFDEMGNPLPLYKKMITLIHQHWMTHETVMTNKYGEVELQAFYGDYNMIIHDQNGNKHYHQVSFPENNNIIFLQSI